MPRQLTAAPFVRYLFSMRFILRTIAQQAKLEGRVPVSEDPDDYAVVVDGPVVGHISRFKVGVFKDQWGWFLHWPVNASGCGSSLEDATAKLRASWFDEQRKLRRD